MSEQKYDPKKYALELGFSEADADALGKSGVDATLLRRLAKAKRAKGLIPEQIKMRQSEVPPPKKEAPAESEAAPPEPKKHQHSYRKDGTCACGIAFTGDYS